HVHVGIDDDELRIDLMNQLTYFLPHMLALSCSSPFWEGERTGLMSFRMLVFNAVPRTGLPEPFPSWSEYRRHTDTLHEARVLVADDGHPPPHRHAYRDRCDRRCLADLVGSPAERALPDARDARYGLLHHAR